MNIKKTYLFLVSLFLIIGSVNAQITLKNVSVINSQGHVLIDWDYTGTDDLIIRRDSVEINGLSEIARVNPTSSSSYIDTQAKANEKPRSYIVVLSTDQDNVFSDIVSTVHLKYTYDSCNAQMNFQWEIQDHSPYFSNAWTPIKYTLHSEIDGSVSTYDPTGNSYTLDNIPENANTSFYIETTWDPSNTNRKSNSNTIDKYTEMPETPDYINAVLASTNENSVDLKFEIASNTEIEDYTLKKSDAKEGAYTQVSTFSTNELEINATDIDASPDNTVNYYKLVAIDACGNEKTESDISNNIVLTVENNELKNTLSWNWFKGGDWVTTHYDIYRINGSNPAEYIRQFPDVYPESNKFTDDLSRLGDEKISGQICYYVQAIKDNSPGNYSQSNIACVYLEPQIYMPEAFTPNGDGKNDIFNAKYSFVPADFEMKIYNRWGNIIFQTDDPEEGWNGKLSNGKDATTGTYMYYIKISIPSKDPVEKRGNVTVFYP